MIDIPFKSEEDEAPVYFENIVDFLLKRYGWMGWKREQKNLQKSLRTWIAHLNVSRSNLRPIVAEKEESSFLDKQRTLPRIEEEGGAFKSCNE